MQPQSQAIDGGAGDLIVPRRGSLEKTPGLLDTADGGETVFGLGANKREGVPIALEDVLREEADTAVADTHGRWGEAIDVFAVQEVGLEFLFGDHVRRFAIELGEEADFSDIRFLGAFAFATELERGNHLLTPWGHEQSPFLSGRAIGLRRKTS